MEEQTNKILTKKNVISFLVIGILLLSIPFGVRLALEQTQLRSKAANTEITFVTGDTVACTTTNGKESCTTTSDTVPVELRSPFGPPGSSLATGVPSGPPTPISNFKVVANPGSYTFTWNRNPANTKGYNLRFNKDPQTTWLGAGDFIVGINASASSYTTGDPSFASACSMGPNNDWHCTACDTAKQTAPFTCVTTGISTGFVCDGSYYKVTIEDVSGGSSLGLSQDIKCSPLPAPPAVNTACASGGQATLSWDEVNGASSYVIRLDNNGVDSPSWVDYGDMVVSISSNRACSGGKCQFPTGSGGYGDIATSVCLKTSGGACTNPEFINGPAKLLTNTTYSWSVQPIAPGEPYPQLGGRGTGTVNCP